MPQIFHKRSNSLSKFSLIAFVVIIGSLGWIVYILYRSPYATGQGIARNQPVQFDHTHHVGEVGIDCRYCHTFVEDSSFAGIPPTQTCMNCHSQIWSNSPMLQIVRDSYQTGKPIPWTRVNRLPDFVYFDHSIHVSRGVGCVSCHGQVDEMPLMTQAAPLQMHWCLDCHRHPEDHVRPIQEVFNMHWQPKIDQVILGKELVLKNHIQKNTDCSTCHR